MYKRLVAFGLVITLATPLTALADTSGLGPATTPSSSGSSSADAGALQPAGTSLQSADSSSGISSSTSDAGTLQQPASTDNSQLKVLLNGEADTAAASSSHPWWWYVLWVLLGLILIGAGLLVWRRRPRRQPALTRAEAAPVDEPASDATDAPSDSVADETAPEEVEAVHSDEITPPIVSESDNKTGEDSGKVAKRPAKKSRKKHRKNR